MNSYPRTEEEEEEEEECSPFTPGRPRPAHWERRGAIRPDPGESTNHCLLTLQKKNNFIEKMFFFVSVKLFVAVKVFFDYFGSYYLFGISAFCFHSSGTSVHFYSFMV